MLNAAGGIEGNRKYDHYTQALSINICIIDDDNNSITCNYNYVTIVWYTM